MTVEALLLAVTALIAVVAVIAALVAVRAVRRLHQTIHANDAEQTGTKMQLPTLREAQEVVAVAPAAELVPRVVQGRVVVPPTQAQVVRTALGRPGVRLSIFAHGLARALRPENRDRIVALIRREYRHRRRERLQAGRQAVRMARPTSAATTERLHAELMEPRAIGAAERMIGS